MLSKGYNDIPRPTSFNRQFYLRAMMACPTRRPLIICAVEGLRGHAKLNIVRPCVRSTGDDGMSRPML